MSVQNEEYFRTQDRLFYDRYPLFLVLEPVQRALRDATSNETSCGIRVVNLAKMQFGLLALGSCSASIGFTAQLLLCSATEMTSAATQLTHLENSFLLTITSILLYKSSAYAVSYLRSSSNADHFEV